MHDGAVWTTNTDAGTLIRLPIDRHGASAQPKVRATGLTNVDDFAFTGNGNQVLAALFGPNQVVLVGDNGTHQTVLDPEDGLENPTAVAVRHHTVYVDGSARSTRVDLNLVPAPARLPLTSRRQLQAPVQRNAVVVSTSAGSAGRCGGVRQLRDRGCDSQ